MIGAPQPLAAKAVDGSYYLHIPCLNIKYHRADLATRPLGPIAISAICRLTICELGQELDYPWEFKLDAGEIYNINGVPIGTLVLGSCADLEETDRLTLQIQLVQGKQTHESPEFTVQLHD